MSSLISIIIPAYNRAHLIGETIVSIQKQTYVNWECIIIDDDSIDDTEAVVLKYQKNDQRIVYYKKPTHLPKGPSAARNYGFTKSKGAYINWFDSDDLMHPEKLEKDLKHITSGDYDFTISQSAFFKENGIVKKAVWNETLWSNSPINDFIILEIGWSTNAPLWKRDSLKARKLSFKEELITADDYLYHIQAMQYGLKPIVIKEVLVYQREHEQRLEHYHLKSPSKLKVFNYLYLNKKELHLNKKVIFFLNEQCVNQFSNMLKKKELTQSFSFLILAFRMNYSYRIKIIFLKLTLFGIFYYLFGIGYSKLN